MLTKLNLQPTPFRFLLYTEWFLLASCGSLAIIEAFEKGHLPVQHILILLGLWGLGLALPMGGQLIKILYTVVEIGLIFYGALRGYLHILPMLYLIVTIRSCFLFAPAGRWAVAGLTFVLFLSHQIRYVQNIIQIVQPQYQQRFWIHLMGETLMFGLGLFLVLKLASALLSERELWTELTIAHQQLQQYAQQEKELAAVQERNRIARNIHDSLGHVLSALNFQLQAAIERWRNHYDTDQIKPFVEQAYELGTDAMREVRESVRALRSEGQSMTEAISDLVQRFQDGTGIPAQLSVEMIAAPPVSVSETTYRVVQEALTNIHKHAQASTVRVTLKASRNQVRVEVIDDGCGFDSQRSFSSGFGLTGMRERVIALGGTLEVVANPGCGCHVVAEVPI